MAGTYYNPYRKALSQTQMQTNAIWVRDYLQPQGWTLNAIAACLGNWESECTINPNRPQKSGYPATATGGFGLPQWTPWLKKYGTWAKNNGIYGVANDNNPQGRFEPQLAYHEYECKYGVNGKKTWYNNRGYSYTWEQFKHSTDSPETLAEAYYWQYERSGAMAVGSRPANARKWYNFLSGQSYNPISETPYNNGVRRTSSVIGNLKLLYLYILIYILFGKRG